jgi:hypothetical protein
MLGGALSGESFTLSQSYYFGKVEGAAAPLIHERLKSQKAAVSTAKSHG